MDEEPLPPRSGASPWLPLVGTLAFVAIALTLVFITPSTGADMSEQRAYLETNASKEGVIVTDSGLQVRHITEGDGPNPAASDTVRVHYRGTLIDGSQFDSSYDRGQPIEFPLNRVIAGWTEGLQLMKVGGKAELVIPSELGYGESGAGGAIPGGATLIFEVELLAIP